ncbi:MAG TPA: glycine cleavage system protein GcvH [Bacteroidia bacterium]|nr:glycine cleavage system protein GcvH [Bacteroidia bacterium]HRS59338.1 glycine cleavage system protein GcvH [Bacteroidia bacterium]HRU67208.1 glycine cleavage system protein GcvH [Bacteroidia bacterium]
MIIPVDLKFTKDHEWIRVEGTEAYVGITDFAQKELGDIVYIEIETVGDKLSKGDAFGTIEAVKTVSDMYMPASGHILEKNPEIDDSPELVNKDPYGKGWMIKITLSDPAELNDLLSPEEYAKLIEE